MKIFEEIESEVQSYARSFPRVFNRAKGELMWDEEGNEYLDFLAGAGTLNYGHNNPHFKDILLTYIQNDGITHGLDMHTRAKGEFLQTFNDKILKPRKMEYMVQFTGPTGTNAVEAAMKRCEKLSTGRLDDAGATMLHRCPECGIFAVPRGRYLLVLVSDLEPEVMSEVVELF